MAAPMAEPGTELAVPGRGSRETLDALMQFGGFPEPFLAASSRSLRRWQKERFERFFREDAEYRAGTVRNSNNRTEAGGDSPESLSPSWQKYHELFPCFFVCYGRNFPWVASVR